ncbi:MAG: 16S rRNA (cytosine(1402)-N(4))-methyltransferase, partial [Methylocystis sp.]|nr:16S rRNA (cytosine(1402)-N(4))-methyltransferase [Methylocystis sp.]
MVDDPSCDLALISWLFWSADPGFVIRNPEHYQSSGPVRQIVENVERGFYGDANLFYDRHEAVVNAQKYIGALKEAGVAPFPLSRVLCGPFNGRRAEMPAIYDPQTERELAEIFYEYGEERFARRIARQIVARRPLYT